MAQDLKHPSRQKKNISSINIINWLIDCFLSQIYHETFCLSFADETLVYSIPNLWDIVRCSVSTRICQWYKVWPLLGATTPALKKIASTGFKGSFELIRYSPFYSYNWPLYHWHGRMPPRRAFGNEQQDCTKRWVSKDLSMNECLISLPRLRNM